MRQRPTRGLAAAVILCACTWQSSLADPERPDLVVDQGALGDDWTVGIRYIPPGDCAIAEGCVLASGWRKLLVFTVQTANISQVPLSLGNPTSSPFFEFSACHGHYHLVDFSDYALATPSGTQVGASSKYGWCLVDGLQYLSEPWVPAFPSFSCDDQGISPGWSDIYDTGLDCQWIDVTGLALGDYLLSATVNAGRRIHESDLTNNTSTVPVTIPDLAGLPDFRVDAARLSSTLQAKWRIIGPGHPLVVEGCVSAPGLRRLLSFGFDIVNAAPFDSSLGNAEDGSPYFEFFPGTTSPRLKDFLEYRLFDTQGSEVVPAVTQERFFPKDKTPSVVAPWVRPGLFYFASVWGLQRGWSTRVEFNLDCQWVDVTDLPSGAYDLSVTVNPRAAVPEGDLTNNSATVRISLQENSAGVAHRPDGYRMLGAPLKVEAAPGGLRLLYDVASCPVAGYNVYTSDLPPSSRAVSAVYCNIGSSGDLILPIADPSPGGLTWILVVGQDGTREGGAGFDSEGRVRSITAIPQCGLVTPDPTSLCAPPTE